MKTFAPWRAAACVVAFAAAARSQTLLYSIPNAGYWTANGGDVNGDGQADLLIGDPLLNVGGVPHTGRGRVYSGLDGSLLFDVAAPAGGIELGWATSGLGDLNADGKSEFLLGSRFSSPNGVFQAGEVRVHDGATGAVLQLFQGTYFDGRFGHGLAGGGHLDADGVPDILVGDVTASPNGLSGGGRVVGYSGASFSILVDIPCQAAGDWFGNDVAFVGDLTGDGLDEFVAGAPLHEVNLPQGSQVGRANLYSAAGALLAAFDGSAPQEFFGYTVAPGGRIDGDAVPDFLIGAPFAENGSAVDVGKVVAISGATLAPIATYWGENAEDQFSYGLDGGADVDFDGRADILVGAIGYDAGTLSNAGRAYLISGRTGANLHVATGAFSGGNYGRRVAMLGTVNCGAVPDYAIGGTRTEVYSFFPGCTGPGFSFGAGGNHGQTAETGASLTALAGAPTSFYLGLGDLGLGGAGTETAWAAYVQSLVGSTYPFEVLAGDREDDDGPAGSIGAYASGLPDRMGASGAYGAECFFDVQGLARVILISPGLTIGGETYAYVAGNPHYAWLAARIDEGRAAGLPWVIVGMHGGCLSAIGGACEIGTDLLNLLLDRRVDLVLQGGSRSYQRSKQLACATPGSFVSSCVVDDGADGVYGQGSGTVFVVSGCFGEGLDAIDLSDPEIGNFATWMGANANPTFGFAKVGVLSPTLLSVDFVGSAGGIFADSFTIVPVAPPPPPPPPPSPFTFVPNLYLGTNNAAQASGNIVTDASCPPGTDTCYQVALGMTGGCSTLGGPAGGCSGGWLTNFTLAQASDVTISFDYTLELSGDTEAGEFSRLFYWNPATGQAVLAAELQGVNGDGPAHVAQGSVADLYTLPAGSHTFHVGAWHNGIGTTTENGRCWVRNIVVQIGPPPPPPPPVLNVSPAALSFSAFAGGADPPSQSLAVANGGGGTFDWSAIDDAPWMTVLPAGGSGNGTLTVSVTAAGLAEARYSGSVTVTATDVQGSPRTILVTLDVVPPPPPALSVAPTSLTFTGIVGGVDPPSQSLAVTNAGAGTLDWTATVDAPWLSVSPAAGSGNASLAVAASTAGLAVATYNGNVTVSAPGAAGSPQTIPVTLNVVPVPPPAFTYVDDLYQGTALPNFAAGNVVTSASCAAGDCLHVGLSIAPAAQGNCNAGCSGGWRTTFTAQAASVTISFAYTLVHAGSTETGEMGRLYSRNPVTGGEVLEAELLGVNGNTANHVVAGVVTRSYAVTPGNSYTFDVGAWHRAGSGNEFSECYLDNLSITYP